MGKNKAGFPLRETVVSALTLTLITAAATAALAFTNNLTKENIRARQEQAADEGRRKVISADSFTPSAFTDGEKTVEYHIAERGGETVGYVFFVKTSGKSAGMVILTGISTAGDITGVAVTQNNETAGYVEKIEKAGFLKSFRGKRAGGPLDIDAVAQATKTSKGVTDGVNRAMALYRLIQEEKS